MAQFDVWQNLTTASNKQVPYLLDVQSDLLNGLSTRMVIPLILASEFNKPIKSLNPVFKIKNINLIMLTNEMSGIPIKLLGQKVASLLNYRDEIIQAIDILMTGI